MAVAILVAGGSGRRFGGIVPKQFLPLAGRPLLAYTLERFLECDAVQRVHLVLPRERFDEALNVMRPYLDEERVETVPGGDSRQASVWEGLCSISEAGDPLVAVHDGARPLVSVELIQQVIDAAESEAEGGAIAAVPVVETLKEVSREGRVERTVDRERFFRAQTPQCFRRALLVRAFRSAKAAGFVGTDESAIVERLGAPIRVVPGSERNLKITNDEDLARVERELSSKGRRA